MTDDSSSAEQNDWRYPSETGPEILISTSLSRRYGFLDAYNGYFTHASHTSNEVNELGEDAERVLPSERTKRRVQHEDEKWDEEHYLYAFLEVGLCA